MSKANSPIKVLHTALNRLQRGWTKGTFYEGPGGGDGGRRFRNGSKTAQVCLRGAIHGYQGQIKTEHSILAEIAVLEAINELYPESAVDDGPWDTVTQFNDDRDTTFEMIEKTVKLGLIKLETGWTPINSRLSDFK